MDKIMPKDESIQLLIFDLQAKIEHAENTSSGSIEDDSLIDHLRCELFKLEETTMKKF